MVCSNCKADIADGSKVCGQCGAPMAGASLSPAIVPSMSSAERRQLTVMFCDLVGSTALSVRLDPEDLREVMVAYQTYAAETVSRFGGFVAGFMGSPSMNFLNGRLATRNGALCVEIPLANGAVAALPLARPPAVTPDSGKVVLGIRPEHLYRYDAELKAKKPALTKLIAPVELVEPTGAETVAKSAPKGRMS